MFCTHDITIIQSNVQTPNIWEIHRKWNAFVIRDQCESVVIHSHVFAKYLLILDPNIYLFISTKIVVGITQYAHLPSSQTTASQAVIHCIYVYEQQFKLRSLHRLFPRSHIFPVRWGLCLYGFCVLMFLGQPTAYGNDARSGLGRLSRFSMIWGVGVLLKADYSYSLYSTMFMQL